MAQEPTSPTNERDLIIFARFLIKSELPAKREQGRGILRRIRNRNARRHIANILKRCNAVVEYDSSLLAKTRGEFIKMVEEKRSDG